MNTCFDAFSAALQQPAASKQVFIILSEARRSLLTNSALTKQQRQAAFVNPGFSSIPALKIYFTV